MELTLIQLFGVNAFQDGQILKIQKSDLPLLTPSINNTAESLLVAIVLKALENFEGSLTTETDDFITDEFDNPVTFNNGDIFTTLYAFNWNPYIAERLNSYVARNSVIIQFFTQVL
jgi:hypothetical protein